MNDDSIDIKYADTQIILESVRASQITGADPLSPDEVAALARRIEQSNDILDKGTLLRALAFTGDDQYRYILDSFLGGPDPTLAGWSLWHLCVYWGLTSEYLGLHPSDQTMGQVTFSLRGCILAANGGESNAGKISFTRIQTPIV